ncbi:MAG: hypothetical protein AB1424_10955 [Thermodesulfobacteriota bacterium]
MGKRKWKRVRLTDLASEATQQEILDLIAQANEAQAQEPHKRPSEAAQAGR